MANRVACSICVIMASISAVPSPASASVWTQQALIERPAFPSQPRRFGESIDIDQDTIVVGAVTAIFGGTGAVFVYSRSPQGAWDISHTIEGDEGRGSFGVAVNTHNGLLVVGDQNIDTTPFGDARFYQLEDLGGYTEKTLASPGFGPTQTFGASVAVMDEVLVVGSLQNEVIVYDKLTSDLDPSFELWLSDTRISKSLSFRDQRRRFGKVVALDGSTLVIGEEYRVSSTSDPGRVGSVNITERGSDGLWSGLNEIQAPAPAVKDFFGSAIALDGDYLVVGALGDDEFDDFSGAAYIYERDGTGSWGLVKKLLASTPLAQAGFGKSVGISGDNIIVGSNGAAYMFERDLTGEWNEVQKISDPNLPGLSRFGNKVGISGGTAILTSDDGLHVFVVPEPAAIMACGAGLILLLQSRRISGRL
jgi:FG-GAP repeat protein